MRKYKKGIETEQKIIDAARAFFRENGYNKTSVTEICESIGIMTGNASYYFPHKSDLGIRIFRDFMLEVLDYVENEFPTENTYFKYTLDLYICMLVELADSECCRFVKEVFERGFFTEYATTFAGRFTPEYNMGSEKKFTEQQMRKTIVANNAVYSSLVIDLIKESGGMPSRDEIIRTAWITTGIIGRIFGGDIDENHKVANRALEIVKRTDLSRFHFL